MGAELALLITGIRAGGLREVEEAAVPVEVNDMVGLPGIMRLTEAFDQGLERGGGGGRRCGMSRAYRRSR